MKKSYEILVKAVNDTRILNIQVLIVLMKDVPVMACCVMGFFLETIHHLPTSQTFGFVVEMWFEKIPSASVPYCILMAISR